MIASLIVLATTLGGYLLGRRAGQRKAIDELWEPAMALGAYGQQIRTEATADGVPAGVRLDVSPEICVAGMGPRCGCNYCQAERT